MFARSMFRRGSDDVLTVALPRCRGHEPTGDCSYRVAWQINPHMNPGATDSARAEAQHAAFVCALRDAGAEVVELPFVHSAFDSVFVKDNALLKATCGSPMALLLRFTEAVRQREQVARAQALQAMGFNVQEVPGPRLEGGDVVRLPDGATLLGYGFRSEEKARHVLRAFLDGPVMTRQLKDPWLYHLDTALGVLADGTVLCCPDAFTDDALSALARHPSVTELLFVPREEALQFALNFVQVAETIITGSTAPRTTRLLREHGLSVKHVPLTEFQLAGGSAACLVSRVYAERRVAVSDTNAMRSTSA